MKRALDVAASLAGLLILGPVFVVVAILVYVDDPGPVLFRQVRVGRYGTTFTMLKFRTMRRLPGGAITVGSDPRITRVGARLRRWKLDELPQLANVLLGHMSLVGPRPEIPEYVRDHAAVFQEIAHLRPGITDPASLRYRREAELLATVDDPERYYTEVILPDKIRRSAQYARHATVADDLRVILATLGLVKTEVV